MLTFKSIVNNNTLIPDNGISADTTGERVAKLTNLMAVPLVFSQKERDERCSVSNEIFFARISKEARYNRKQGAIESSGYINYSQLRLVLIDKYFNSPVIGTADVVNLSR